jgi:GMP synthase-like glutamine amidotransferase
MKPVAVFQHTPLGAPGTVVPILQALGCPVQIVRVLDGEAVPADASAFSGLVFMGGYMGVHDDLPWIAQELALIRDAHARGLPLAGHCLGSQLVALALGGTVHKHTRAEIGWNPLVTADDTMARDWWGPFAGRQLETFQWHGDTFVPPTGAQQLASAPHCDHQVFVLDERHLLVQSHLEMTPELVALYQTHNGAQLERQFAAGNPAASPPAELQRNVDARTAQMTDALRQLYRRWVRGLR